MNDISVLLPVAASSDPNVLSRAHQSIIEQTKQPAEVLLVTNQPLTANIKSGISDLVETHSISYHKHFPDAHGLGGVLQAGLKKCTETFVARMDTDDIADPKRFAKQLAVLKETEADIVGSHLAEFRKNPESVERTRWVPTSHNKIDEWMSWRCPMNHPTTMFDRQAVLDAGGYRDFPMMEDWDLWARCLAAGLRFRNLDQTLVRAEVDELSDRRNGLQYAKAEVRMARELRKLGIASHLDTLQHLCLRVPPRVLPEYIIERIYNWFVR